MIRIAIAAQEENECQVAAFDGAFVIGRAARSDLVLTARGVSSSHCRLSPMAGLEGAFMVEDLGSTYGTYVNGARVGKPVVVSERDVITVGSYRLAVVGASGDEAALQRVVAVEAPPVPPGSTPSQAEPEPPPTSLADFDANAPWPEQFARIDTLAREWHEAGRPKSALLQGASIRIAERWLEAGARREPTPDALHRDFINRSRRATSSRIWTVVVALLIVGVIGGGAAAWFILEPDLGFLFAEPETILPEDNGGVETGDGGPLEEHRFDIAALTEQSTAIPDFDTRLLVQAGIAQAAHDQSERLVDGAGWDLFRATHQTLSLMRETILPGHEAPVLAVAFGPAGRYLVSAGEDSRARLWDLSVPGPTKAEILGGHTGPIHAAGITPDGRWIVTCGDDKTVTRWDLTATAPSAAGHTLRVHNEAVTHLAMHPTGRFVATGDLNGVIVLWDLEAADPEATADKQVAHEALVADLEFDYAAWPSLYSAGDDGVVRRWRAGPGGLRRAGKIEAEFGGFASVAASPDSRWVAAGVTTGEVYLWDRSPKAKVKKRLLAGHTASVNALSFTPDSKLLVTGGDDDTLRVWDMTVKDPGLSSLSLSGHSGDIVGVTMAVDGKKVVSHGLDAVRIFDLDKRARAVDQYPLEGHSGTVRSVSVAPDGLWLATGADDGTVRVWDALGRSPGRSGKILRLGPEQVLDVAVTRIGDRIAAVGGGGRAAVWNLGDEARRPRPLALPGLTGLVTAVAFDPSGTYLATAVDSGEIQLWPITEPDPIALRRNLAGHEGSVNGLAFTPGSDRLISIGSDRTVRAWPVGGTEGSVWSGHADEVHVLAISPKGRFAVTGGLDGSVIRWDLGGGAPVKFKEHEAEIIDLAISSDGTRLATASADRRAVVWNLPDGKRLHVLRNHDEAVTAAAFGRDLVATGGRDEKIFLWNLASEHPDEKPRVLTGHGGTIGDLTFAADGTILISASNDKTLRVWRLDTGDSIELQGHDKVVSQARVTGDGRHLLSASYDGTVRLWPLTYERLAWLACDVTGLGLPPDTWSKLFGDPAPPPVCVAD